MDRMKDAEIAVKEHGWQWVNMHGIREILIPPKGHKMENWVAMWDENGIPHYLPKYSQETKFEITRITGICTICWKNSTKDSEYVDVCDDCLPLTERE